MNDGVGQPNTQVDTLDVVALSTAAAAVGTADAASIRSTSSGCRGLLWQTSSAHKAVDHQNTFQGVAATQQRETNGSERESCEQSETVESVATRVRDTAGQSAEASDVNVSSTIQQQQHGSHKEWSPAEPEQRDEQMMSDEEVIDSDCSSDVQVACRRVLDTDVDYWNTTTTTTTTTTIATTKEGSEEGGGEEDDGHADYKVPLWCTYCALMVMSKKSNDYNNNGDLKK